MKLFQTLIIFILLGLIGYTTREHWFADFVKLLTNKVPVTPEKEFDKGHSIKRIQVLRGDQFDILLDNNIRILAKLKVLATEESKSKVVNKLNELKVPPRVILLDKMPDGQWLIDFTFEEKGDTVSLASWLQENKLIYD